MQLTFKTVRLHNFMSYGDAELPLSKMGYSIVTGENNRVLDNSKSNGSGKSSVFNAICFALTGETIQGIKTNLENIYADPDDCWVELELDVNQDEYVIKRIKTPRNHLKIYVNGEDVSGKGITESNKILSDLLPDITSTLLGSVIVLGQGMPYRFADAHPGGRKEVLEKLTKSDFMIQIVREKLDARQSQLKDEHQTINNNLVSTKTAVDLYEKQSSTIQKELADIDSYNQEYTLDDRLVYLDAKITRLNNELTDLDDKLNKNALELDETNKQIQREIKLTSEVITVETKALNESITETTKSLVETRANINSLTKEIKKLEAVTDICPTCGQKIPDAHKVDTTEHHVILNSYKTNENTLNSDLEKLKLDKDNLVKRINNERAASISNLESVVKQLKTDSTEYTKSISELRAKIEKSRVEQAKVRSMKDNRDKLVLNLAALTSTINDLKDQVKKHESDLTLCDEHLKVVQNLVSLTKREYRSVLLKHVISYLDSKVKEYARTVFNTDLLTFELNDNYIDIKYDGKFYETLSGGEKQKVDVIIQLALRNLLCTQLGFRCNILVVDEIFDNLDQTGCQNVIDLISKLNDIDSVFIISHYINELQLSYDNEIFVTKNQDGISSITIK